MRASCTRSATSAALSRRSPSASSWTSPGDPPLLLQRTFIVVRQPLREYPAGAAPPGSAHHDAARTIAAADADHAEPRRSRRSPAICFLITAGGLGRPVPLPAQRHGRRRRRHRSSSSSPLVFIISTSAWNAATITNAKALVRRGQRATSSPPVGAQSRARARDRTGDTTYAADTLVFTAVPSDADAEPAGTLPPHDQPGFWPELDRADVRAPALEIVAGQEQAATVKYHQSYRDNGLGGFNRGEVIAELAGGAPVPLGFGDKGDRAGGLLQPSMAVAGLSRRLGAGRRCRGADGDGARARSTPRTSSRVRSAGAAVRGVHARSGAGPDHRVERRATRRGSSPRAWATRSLVARIEWKPGAAELSRRPTPIFVVTGATRRWRSRRRSTPRGAASRSRRRQPDRATSSCICCRIESGKA